MSSVVWYSGATPQVVLGIEGTTGETFKAGDLLLFDTGTVKIATAGRFDAIARRDATGTAGGEIEIEIINLDSIYISKYTTGATAQSLMGDILDYTFTAGAHTLDESGATTDVVCVGFMDPVGTAGGRLFVKFLHGATMQA